MKTRLLAGAGMLALGALVGCSTLEVSSDYDRAANFSKYRTFNVIRAPEIKNELINDRLYEAVQKVLVSKGLTQDFNNPDMLVAFHARLSKETQIDTSTYGYGWGGGWGYWNRWGYGGMGTATSTVRDVPVGMLIIDVVDAREKKMVWQAVASDTLDPRATADEKDRRVAEAMDKMFANFPPQ